MAVLTHEDIDARFEAPTPGYLKDSVRRLAEDLNLLPGSEAKGLAFIALENVLGWASEALLFQDDPPPGVV